MLDLIGVFLIFLCWGSFLNVVGFRLVREQSLFGRSVCPSCNTKLVWYDLIPVFSWLTLKGACRTCTKKISLLYPLIELLTAVAGLSLVLYSDPHYWLGYFLFFSALIVTIRTDAEMMLISRYMTWGMVPVGVALSFAHALPISGLESIAGTLFGYTVLWTVSKSFQLLRKKEGLGQGDLDLLAMIGSFTGVFGAWIALFIGAFLGSFAGLFLVLKTKRRDVQIPFGPWLALGAMSAVFLQNFLKGLM